MKQGGKSPLGIVVVVLIVLVAALGGLIGYSKLSAQNEPAYKGVLAYSNDTGKTVVNNNGEITTIPDNVVMVGGLTQSMGLISDSLNKSDDESSNVSSDNTVANTDSTSTVTDVPETADTQDSNTSDTGTTGTDNNAVEENGTLKNVIDNAAENAKMLMLYHENSKQLMELLGYNVTDAAAGNPMDSDATALDPDGENGETEEPVVFLDIYYQGTDDRSVAKIQERLMQLGFMEFAEPTEHYGPITMEAVKLFQRQNDLSQDGIIGQQTIAMLFDENAKSYLLKKGMDGDDVRRVQNRLYELGYLAKKELVTGHFGDDTEAAVKAVQKANYLAADGKIGVMTFELLYSEDVKANLISFGDKSDVVLECQKRLKELGYLTTTPDGFYGEDTLAAVKLFQSRNDCIVDGFLGPSTREALISSSAKSNGLVLGDQNDTVKKVQQLLIKYGYLDKGCDTGYFGDLTEKAVKKFQANNGLSADGNVGQKTMAKLTGSSVVKAGSGSGGSGSGGSGSGGSGSGGSGSGGSGSGGGGTVSYNLSPDSLIQVAESKLGCKYVWGNKGPDTFDCSGFVYWCLKQIGVNQSYITSKGWRTVGKYKKITDFNSIKKGDIIVVYGHVGIGAGNGVVIDASSSNGKVVKRTMGDWWKRNFICAWRIFD